MSRRSTSQPESTPDLQADEHGITSALARRFAEKHAAGWARLSEQAWKEGQEWAGRYADALDIETAYALAVGSADAWHRAKAETVDAPKYGGTYAEVFWEAVLYNLGFGLEMAFKQLRTTHGLHGLLHQKRRLIRANEQADAPKNLSARGAALAGHRGNA